MEANKKVAQGIKIGLATLGLSFQEASRKLGMKDRGMSTIVSRPISHKTAYLLHQAFGFDENFLMTGEGSIFGEDDKVCNTNPPERECGEPRDVERGVYIPAATADMYNALSAVLDRQSQIIDKEMEVIRLLVEKGDADGYSQEQRDLLRDLVRR